VVSVLARVTRSVCEKIPQSVAKYIFVNITKCFVLAPEKSNPKMGAACVIFFKKKTLHKVNKHPLGENSPYLVTLVLVLSEKDI
jgi:hypothetical protein